jgi:hypothetical protein
MSASHDGPSVLRGFAGRAAGRGSIAGLLVARWLVAWWLLGVVVRGVGRAWSGWASGGPGRLVRVEDRALTEDWGSHRTPKSPGEPNIPRFFSIIVTGGVPGAGSGGGWRGRRLGPAAGRVMAGGWSGPGRSGASERDRRVDREPSRGTATSAPNRVMDWSAHSRWALHSPISGGATLAAGCRERPE